MNLKIIEIKTESENPITLNQLMNMTEIEKDDEIWGISYEGTHTYDIKTGEFKNPKNCAIITINRPEKSTNQ